MGFIDEYYDQSDEPRWYVAHTYSGYENKVKTNLEKIVENRGISDRILDVRVPTEIVTEIDGGKEKQVESKVFPSYVLVKMIMSDETWHVVRNISGVTGFVGPGSKPVPLSEAEVLALGVEESTPKISVNFKTGDTVIILDGPLAGSRGKVQDISPDLDKVTVLANMFGRETPFELDIKSIKLAD